MAKKIGGLGKGLGAIFVENESEDRNEVVELKISQIEPNREQPRQTFDEESLKELAESIDQFGVLQPIVVRPLISGGYQIVAGERRYRACRMLGKSEIPALVRELSDLEMTELALIENLQREDLTPLEEAYGYKMLFDEFDLSHGEIGEAVGKSRSAVSNSLRLLTLPSEVLDLMEDGELSAGHARALLALEDGKEIAHLGEEIAEKGLSVRETEELVKKMQKKGSAKKNVKKKKPTFFREVELSLSEEFGTKVEVVPGRKKGSGKLCIEFYDEEQLKTLSNRLEKMLDYYDDDDIF